jgi:hypothetical protein
MVGAMLAIGFVSPMIFWAGALLASVPIIIHILNRRRFKLVQWAAMDFLLHAMRRNRRRIRFEQMLLLTTRCLLLLLAGIALARPFGCQSSSIGELVGRRSGLHVLVINNSYSMAYQVDRPNARTQLDQAKIIAKGIVDRLNSGGESVAIVLASRPASALIATPAYDLKSVMAAIDRIPQSYRGTDEAGALQLAADIARTATDQSNKTLYLIDDSKRIAWQSDPDAIRQAGHDLAGLYKNGITHFNLSVPGEWNDAVVDIASADSLVTDRFAADFVADVRGFGPAAPQANVVWKVDDLADASGAITAKISTEASPLTYTVSSLSGGYHIVSATITPDDRLEIDNTRSRVVDVVSQLKVLIVEGERGVGGLGSSGAFLDIALNPSVGGPPGGKPASYISTDRISDLELENKILGDYRCVCLCGVGQIQDDEAEQLEKFVRQGGTLMVFMGDPVTAENYNATLYKHGLLPGPLTQRVSVAADQTPRRFAFDPKGVVHPILADFAGHENTGLEAAEIYSYWQIDLPANSKAERVLDFLPPAESKNQPPDPAITVHSLGAGRVVFYATSADPNSEWTTFMAHQAYPALMHMLVLGTVSSGDSWMNLIVGQPLTIPAYVKLSTEPLLKDSDQNEYPLQQETDADGQQVYRGKPLEKPGIYSLSTGLDNFKIAVDLPPDEADIRTLDDSGLKKALGDIDVQLEKDSLPEETIAANSNNDFGWSFMAVVLALAAMECLMAMRFGHYRKN